MSATARHLSSQTDSAAPAARPASRPAQPAGADSSAQPAAASSASPAPLRRYWRYWRYWTSEPVSHPRFSGRWWLDTALVLVVFSVTGSLSLLVVRPLLASVLGVTGSMRDGPNSYRLLSVLLLPPAYSVMLITIGTLAGQHHYFRKVALRMWGRLLPKSWTAASKRPADKVM